VLPLASEQRLEVVRVVLQSELKKLEPAFRTIIIKVERKFTVYLIEKNC